MSMTTLIFARHVMLDEVLERLGAKALTQEFSTWNGRLHAVIPEHDAPGYFVDSIGELHPMELLSHAYPDGTIYHTLVPRTL
jgi:hypothetical protein